MFDFCGSARSASHGERGLEMGCNTFNGRGNRLRRAFPAYFFRQITFGRLLISCWSKLATFCQKKSLANKKSRQKGGFNPTTMISDSILKRSYVHIGSVNWMAAPSRANTISNTVHIRLSQACGAGYRGREDPTCT